MGRITVGQVRRLITAAGAVVMLGTLAVATSAEAAPTGTGRIVVNKRTVGADGIFVFGLLGAEGAPAQQPKGITTFHGAGTTSFDDVAPGTYSLVEAPSPGWSSTGVDCGDDDPADLTVEGGQVITCTFTNEPMVALSKTVTRPPKLVPGQTSQFDVGYSLTMTNNTDSRLELSVGDALGPPVGIALLSASLDSVPDGFTPSGSWNGTVTASGVIVGETVLEGGESMTLPMTMRVAVDTSVATPASRDCVREAGEGLRTGAMNFGLVTFPTNEQRDGSVLAFACAPLSTLTLLAQVTNDHGGTLTPAGITLEARDGATPLFTGSGSVVGAVGVTPLTMTGSAAAGYARSAFTCEGATAAADVVTVAAGTDATCVVRYDDDPPATTTSTTTTIAPAVAAAPTTTVAGTLPRTGSRAANSAGLAAVLLVVGGTLVVLAGVRRRA
jgi:Prealbumin-like fold domain